MLTREPTIRDDEMRVQLNLRGGQVVNMTLARAAAETLRDSLNAVWEDEEGREDSGPGVVSVGQIRVRTAAIDAVMLFDADTWNERARQSDAIFAR